MVYNLERTQIELNRRNNELKNVLNVSEKNNELLKQSQIATAELMNDLEQEKKKLQEAYESNLKTLEDFAGMRAAVNDIARLYKDCIIARPSPALVHKARFAHQTFKRFVIAVQIADRHEALTVRCRIRRCGAGK